MSFAKQTGPGFVHALYTQCEWKCRSNINANANANANATFMTFHGLFMIEIKPKQKAKQKKILYFFIGALMQN